jgi:putative transposase
MCTAEWCWAFTSRSIRPERLRPDSGIAHAALPKETWLAKRGIVGSWPCWGFPARIHLDNAKEFHGEMLRRACEQYGITLEYRPVAQPHMGGHIERLLGTLLRALHELPGATFSNPGERGNYDSQARAVMTLGELERWLTEYIVGVYHAKRHRGIGTSPLQRWTTGAFGDAHDGGTGVVDRPANEERIRLDFLPFVERTVQPYGVSIEGIHYYSDVLRRFVGATENGRRRVFVFRRDPRDISTVSFWDPELQRYSTIPYRNTTHPPISIWELRELRGKLHEAGRAHIDEAAIFEAYRRLREREARAVSETQRTRRAPAGRTRSRVIRPSPPRLRPNPSLRSSSVGFAPRKYRRTRVARYGPARSGRWWRRRGHGAGPALWSGFGCGRGCH